MHGIGCDFRILRRGRPPGVPPKRCGVSFVVRTRMQFNATSVGRGLVSRRRNGAAYYSVNGGSLQPPSGREGDREAVEGACVTKNLRHSRRNAFSPTRLRREPPPGGGLTRPPNRCGISFVARILIKFDTAVRRAGPCVPPPNCRGISLGAYRPRHPERSPARDSTFASLGAALRFDLPRAELRLGTRRRSE